MVFMTFTTLINAQIINNCYTYQNVKESKLYEDFLGKIKENQIISNREAPNLSEIFKTTLAKEVANRITNAAEWKTVQSAYGEIKLRAEIGGYSEIEFALALDWQIKTKECLTSQPDIPPLKHLQEHLLLVSEQFVPVIKKTAEVFTAALAQIRAEDLIENLQKK